MTAPAHRPPKTGLKLTREEARYYGRRAGAVAAARCKYRIEDEYVTTADVAARLGLSFNLAQWRMIRERKQPGPVLWAHLTMTDGERGL